MPFEIKLSCALHLGNKQKLTYIDLFCGTGGFSLGFERAPFRCLGAIDSDPVAIETYRKNFPETPNIIEDDIRKFGPKKFDNLLSGENVDVIIGGPPCQGFSTARMRDGANHGANVIGDERRVLFRQFLEYVEHFRPKAFVFENVPGIRSADGGKHFTALQAEAQEHGYFIHAGVIKSWEHGVPQKRVRQLVIGQRDDLPKWNGELKALLGEKQNDTKLTTMGEAIWDLPRLKAGEGEYEAEYDLERREKHIKKYGDKYLEKVLEISKAKKLTAHVARTHSERDLRDFLRLKEGETSAGAIKRGEEMEFPYNREHFKDRYTRQSRSDLCSTIVAHLSKDGLMFIHPTQQRSLTPREAARIQSFPDWFEFPNSRTHAFRLIGNAVPPLVSQHIGNVLSTLLT